MTKAIGFWALRNRWRGRRRDDGRRRSRRRRQLGAGAHDDLLDLTLSDGDGLSAVLVALGRHDDRVKPGIGGERHTEAALAEFLDAVAVHDGPSWRAGGQAHRELRDARVERHEPLARDVLAPVPSCVGEIGGLLPVSPRADEPVQSLLAVLRG